MMGYPSWAKEIEALVNRDIVYVLVTANMIEAALSGVNVGILEIHTSGNERSKGLRSEETRLSLVQIANGWVPTSTCCRAGPSLMASSFMKETDLVNVCVELTKSCIKVVET